MDYDYTSIAICAICAIMKQFYHFSIILYKFPTKDLLLMLGVKEYAFIEHQFDINENGDLKKEHYHLYVNLHKKKTYGGVYEIINKWCENCTQPQLITDITNVPLFIRYLVHKDDLDKYQYEITDIFSNMEINQFFNLDITDLQFTKQVIELIYSEQLVSFRDIVSYSMLYGKLELIMKRAYFYKSLL